MDILKAATNWAKAELISTPFFILFGLVFLSACIGLWQFGKTDLAKAYLIPTLIAGLLLIIIGSGLFFTNKSRIIQFKIDHDKDPLAFIVSELDRTDATLKEYNNIVFTAIPTILIGCALVLFFVNTPIWRATMITTMGMLMVILLIDGLAHARIVDYQKQLLKAKEELMS